MLHRQQGSQQSICCRQLFSGGKKLENWTTYVEQEQNGASRAEYGKHVIEVASAALTEEFGKDSHKTFMSHNTWLADGLQLKNNISCIISTYTSK